MSKHTFILLTLLAVSFWFGCHSENPRDTAYNKILAFQKSDSMSLSENRGLYMDSLIRACEKFIVNYPKDSMADDLLFSTSTYQATQQRFRLALVQIDKLLNNYPQSKHIAAAMFIKGEILSSNLGEKVEAKRIWEDLIAKYPKDVWAEQATLSIPMLSDTSIEQQFQRIVKGK